MTPLEAEAMVIRLNAAVRNLETTDEEGRYELLSQVVAPSQAVLDASLAVAREQGVSHRGWEIIHADTGSQRLRIASGPRVWAKV